MYVMCVFCSGSSVAASSARGEQDEGGMMAVLLCFLV